jgi:hypothetical protein
MKKLLLTSLGLLLTLSSLSASAIGWRTCDGNKIKWGSNAVTMRASSVSFPAGSAYGNALQTSIDRVNDNPSKFNFSLVFGDSSLRRNNGQNETWFTSDAAVHGGAPARALTWSHCYWLFGWHYGIDEVDVVFNAAESFTASMNKTSLWSFGGAYRPFQTTAVHEFSHAMGLLHENRWYSIMGADWTHIHANGDSARAYLGEDAAEGSVLLYGAASGWMEDLSLTNFKYLGKDGEYSTHQPTQLFNSSNAVLNWFTDAGERRYRVNRGQNVKLELTGENNGKTNQTVKIAYYISTNNLISTADRLISTGTVTLNRDQPSTFKSNVVIPADLVSGTNYWVGAIVDYDNVLTESTSVNNASYLPIRVN